MINMVRLWIGFGFYCALVVMSWFGLREMVMGWLHWLGDGYGLILVSGI